MYKYFAFSTQILNERVIVCCLTSSEQFSDIANTEGAIQIGQHRVHKTQYRQTNQKHNLICVGHHCTQTNTNNVNKTGALLQTTGGKDEPNIFFMWKS